MPEHASEESRRPLRVLMLANAYHPAIGGAESYARAVATGLAALGHQVVVATDGARADGPPTDHGVAVERLRDYRALLEDPTKLPWEQMVFGLVGELADVVARHGVPDLVFANSHDAAVFGSLVAQSHRVPLVVCYHEQDPEQGPLGPGRAALAYATLPIAAWLAGSEFYRDKALASGSRPEATHLIYHGVDTARFATAGPRRPDGRLVLLLSARIAPRKQQDLMIRVLARLVSQGIDARLVLAGRAHSSQLGYLEGLLAEVERLGLTERVDIRQDLSHDDMPAVYADCDVVVQPSRTEGLGLAALEAMAAGRPVVVSDTVGLREVVVDGVSGRLVAPDDEQGWADVLAELFRDPEARAGLAAEAEKRAATVFDVSRMIAETERLLADTVRDWRRGGAPTDTAGARP
jgi:glycosyltransferase involved in cell wall biosynthesis